MNILVANKRILTVMNVVVVSTLIFLFHFGFFSNETWFVFILLCAGVFVLALYRPVIVFALLIGVIPLEIINIVPDEFLLVLRPYQFLMIILLIVTIVRRVLGLSKERFFSWNVIDTLVTIFVGLGFINLLWTDYFSVSVKQSVILFSFGLLYFVVRFFVRSKKDVLALFPIMISSGVVVGVYAIVQNIMFLTGGNHQEVMPGRPNATFSEPDWLGMYIVFMIAISLAYLYYNTYHKHLWKFFDYALYGATSVFFVTLVITVARSAWVGVFCVIGAYGVILFFGKKYKLFAMHMSWVASIIILSLIIVWGFHLTNFELLNRATSTGTGLQEITVSCVPSGQTYGSVPTTINDVSELEQYNCRHINLEEIELETAEGNTVTKIYRTDPNVAVRGDVYGKTFILIKQQPFIGYGWGSSSTLLGEDENGTSLNASNIFLETALSIGIVGGAVLIAIFTTIIIFAVKALRTSSNMMSKSIAIFAILGTVAIIVPNLFNAGLFLGFVWMFFGIVAILRKV